MKKFILPSVLSVVCLLVTGCNVGDPVPDQKIIDQMHAQRGSHAASQQGHGGTGGVTPGENPYGKPSGTGNPTPPPATK